MSTITFPTFPDLPYDERSDAARLRAGLLFNTDICASSGLAALVLASPLGNRMGVAPSLMRVVGIALLAYAPLLLWLRSRVPLRPVHGYVPAALDDLWVVGALVIATAGLGMTTGGRVLLAATAIPVGISAYLQATGARRLT